MTTHRTSRPFSVAAAAALAFGLTLAGAPAVADHGNYYGDSARSVARHIGCKDFRRTGGGAYNLDAGICYIKGKRVNVITFRGRGQQREWNAGVRAALPSSHWWANGEGAVVTARNGNKPAARLGARRLPGQLRHAGF